MTADF